MMIKYRLMTEEDCEAVAKLYAMCFSHPWTLAGVQEMFMVEGYCSFVAEDMQGKIVGYVGMKSVLDEADITNVAVDPAYRKQGIAGQLLEQLLQEAEKSEIHSIFLEVRVSNEAAITLYEHASFEDCGIRKNYYDDPKEDARIMVWKKEF